MRKRGRTKEKGRNLGKWDENQEARELRSKRIGRNIKENQMKTIET